MAQKSAWNFSRFLQTVAYFDGLPFLRWFPCLQETIIPKEQRLSPLSPQGGTVLVVGATGGVGRKVIQLLRAQNYPVRALVRSQERAEELLGKEGIEYYEGDLTVTNSLNRALLGGVRSIICCVSSSAYRLQDPKTIESLYQGVTNYHPKEAQITPEAVDYQGVKNLIQLATPSLTPATEMSLFDFTIPSPELRRSWGAVDDVVMGGISESNLQFQDNFAIFTGNVSTANSGGFASVRNRNFNPPLDLSGYQGIKLRVKGDGQRYKFITRGEGKWDGISYCYSFDTVANQWLDIEIPFQELIPVFRARTLNDVGTFDPSRTYSLQIMLSKFEYDGGLNPLFRPGEFALEMATIKAYGSQPLPKFILVSSARVTRPPENPTLKSILHWKLQGEKVLKESGLSYTIIRPVELIDTLANQELICQQGDVLSGKVSREAIAQLCVQALQHPSACYKTFEVAAGSGNEKPNWEQLFNSLALD